MMGGVHTIQQRRLAIVVMMVVALFARSGTALAQQSSASDGQGGPLLFLSAQYSAPQRWAGGAGVLMPMGKRMPMDGGTSGTRAGVEIEGSAGQGGARLAVGPALIASEGAGMIVGLDVRGTVTRTWKSPRGATTDSTYVGAEAGLAISVVRLAAGVARRVAGLSRSTGTMFTWSVGLQIPLGW